MFSAGEMLRAAAEAVCDLQELVDEDVQQHFAYWVDSAQCVRAIDPLRSFEGRRAEALFDLFRPTKPTSQHNEVLWWGLHDDARLTALCFAAAMADDGEDWTRV